MNKEKALNFIKDKNNLMIICVIVIGVMLMTSFSKTDSGREDMTVPNSQEEKLEKILSDIDGAGDVRVMLTYENIYEKSNAFDVSATPDNATVRGVIVTADGAENMKIKYELTKAVAAVLGVEVHKICIYKRK